MGWLIQYQLTFNTDSMKLVGFTVILLLSAFTFGQSAKKVNARLKAELTVEKQKQDSACQVFQSYNQLNSLQNRLMQKTERFISEAGNVKYYQDVITLTWHTLKRLDQNPEMNDVMTYMNLSNGSHFIRRMLNLNMRPERFDSVLRSTELKGLSIKQQNVRLEARLKEYRDLATLNDLRLRSNISMIKELESYNILVDSAILVYEDAHKALFSREEELEKLLENLRENYRLKGPAGFSDAYQSVFPDVHPIPKKEPVSGDFEFGEGTSEPPPPPAESSRVVAQEPEIFTIVEEFAEFPGGMGALKKYLTDNLKYPERAKEMAISGKVFVQFVVSTGGQISNVKLLRGLPDCKECDTEAIRLVKTMPNWKPGKNNGKTVNSYFNLPVEFKLNK